MSSYFKRPNYPKVDVGQRGRPLVFSFGRPINASHLRDFREATKAAIGVYPYFVSMNNQHLPGIDAQSAYGGKHTIHLVMLFLLVYSASCII